MLYNYYTKKALKSLDEFSRLLLLMKDVIRDLERNRKITPCMRSALNNQEIIAVKAFNDFRKTADTKVFKFIMKCFLFITAIGNYFDRICRFRRK